MWFQIFVYVFLLCALYNLFVALAWQVRRAYTEFRFVLERLGNIEMLRRAAVRRDRLHAEHVATQALLKAVRRELASFRALHDEQRVQPSPAA